MSLKICKNLRNASRKSTFAFSKEPWEVPALLGCFEALPLEMNDIS